MLTKGRETAPHDWLAKVMAINGRFQGLTIAYLRQVVQLDYDRTGWAEESTRLGQVNIIGNIGPLGRQVLHNVYRPAGVLYVFFKDRHEQLADLGRRIDDFERRYRRGY